MDHNPAFLRLVQAAKRKIRECSVAEAQRWLEQKISFHLIDIREDHEFDRDHAAQARHIGRGILERDIEKIIPDKGALIVLYCGGGFRSALSADALQQMGYTNVRSMAGGIKAWREAGFPIECRREADIP